MPQPLNDYEDSCVTGYQDGYGLRGPRQPAQIIKMKTKPYTTHVRGAIKQPGLSGKKCGPVLEKGEEKTWLKN
jgi:hypothetical protein